MRKLVIKIKAPLSDRTVSLLRQTAYCYSLVIPPQIVYTRTMQDRVCSVCKINTRQMPQTAVLAAISLYARTVLPLGYRCRSVSLLFGIKNHFICAWQTIFLVRFHRYNLCKSAQIPRSSNQSQSAKGTSLWRAACPEILRCISPKICRAPCTNPGWS